jgi:hypothetical protein
MIHSVHFLIRYIYPDNIRYNGYISVITDEIPLQYLFFNIHLYNPTQNLIIFHVLYSESKSDKYKLSKLQSTLSLLTTTISDFASRQAQHLAGAFLKRVLTII